MAEWLVEEGIGEERAVLLDGGEVRAARLRWPGGLEAGQVDDAVLERRDGERRGLVRFPSGEHALIDALPAAASEGAKIRAKVSREAISEAGRQKIAQARPISEPVRAASGLAEALGARVVPSFPGGLWDDVVLDAAEGRTRFDGGELVLSPTPAMTVIDVDGSGAAKALALAACGAVGLAIGRLDLSGSIGIDFPTLSDKADRRKVDEALTQALRQWPHEQTAMNGFGFVQLVSRFERASILARVQGDRTGAFARLLLRQAERIAEPGALLLEASAPVRELIERKWEADLRRRTGREIRWNDNHPRYSHQISVQAIPL